LKKRIAGVEIILKSRTDYCIIIMENRAGRLSDDCKDDKEAANSLSSCIHGYDAAGLPL